MTKSPHRIVAEKIQSLNGLSLVRINHVAYQYCDLYNISKLAALEMMLEIEQGEYEEEVE